MFFVLSIDFDSDIHRAFTKEIPQGFHSKVHQVVYGYKEGECYVSETTQSSPFLLSCFIQPSNAFGSATSVRVNHRKVDYAAFTTPDEDGKMICDEVENEGSSVFQTFHVYPYPFVIIPTDEYVDNGDKQMPSIQTFGPAKYKWKSKKTRRSTVSTLNLKFLT